MAEEGDVPTNRTTAGLENPAGETLLHERIAVRPTRAEAERDKDAFYELLAVVQALGLLTNKAIAIATQDKSEHSDANISKRIKNKAFDDEARRRILDRIFGAENLLSGETRKKMVEIPEALYFAFLNHFDVKETSQDSARARIVGIYKLWRFSVEHEGEFVVGRLKFFEDQVTRALRVEMLQRKKPFQGLRGAYERLSGYLFRVSHMYLMLLTDPHTRDVRMTLFPRAKVDEVGTDVNPKSVFSGRRDHIVYMDGFGLGIDGSAGFFSPVHIELVDDADELAKLDDLLDVVPEGDPRVPARVAKQLSRNGPLRRL